MESRTEAIEKLSNSNETQVKQTEQIMENVKKYLDTNSYENFTERIKKTVIGQDAGIEAMCLQVYKWLVSVANRKIKNHNTILAAPSGSGKTAFYYALKDVLNSIGIPIINFDASSITPVGYIGNDCFSIFDTICSVNRHCEGISICFLDEIDKIFLSSVDSNGRDFHKEAQSCLLKMIEGGEYVKPDKNGEKMYINTANTLFIGMGAFQDIRESRLKTNSTAIGFGTSKISKDKSNDLFSPITDKDIINYGAQVELIGRFEKIVNYSKLDSAALKRIIKKIADELLPFEDWSISVSDNALKELAEYIDNERGIRFIRAKISETIDKVLPMIFAEYYTENTYGIKINSLDDVTYVAKQKFSKIAIKKTVDSRWESITEKHASKEIDSTENSNETTTDNNVISDFEVNIDDILLHKVFGEGKVIKISDTKFTVHFADNMEKDFSRKDNISKYFSKK